MIFFFFFFFSVRGVVTVDTFVSYFNIPQLELMRMIFTPFDEDGNGILDFEEFLLILCTVASYNRPELLRFLFNIFDMDGQGTIDTVHLPPYSTSLGFI
jgi:Ca2+-binding EF-hand superfamily protein